MEAMVGTENGMCYECSLAMEEFAAQPYRDDDAHHTADGRRFADPITYLPFRETNQLDESDPFTWLDAMGDGLSVDLRANNYGADNMEAIRAEQKNRQRGFHRRLFREVDLLGPERIVHRLSSGWISPMNMRPEMGVGFGLIKGVQTASPIMCGGGGGWSEK